MRAITIRPPWVYCIAHGFKTVENRGRPTAYRGLIALHAGRTADSAADYDPRVRAMWGSGVRIGQPVGAVVKVARLVDCHRAHQPPDGLDWPTCCGKWADRWYKPGLPSYHLVLGDIFHLPEPVYVRGQQSVPWTLPPEVAEKVADQLGEKSTNQREENDHV